MTTDDTELTGHTVIFTSSTIGAYRHGWVGTIEGKFMADGVWDGTYCIRWWKDGSLGYWAPSMFRLAKGSASE